MHTYVYICLYIHIYMYIYVHLHTHTDAYTCTYIYTYTYTHTYVYISQMRDADELARKDKFRGAKQEADAIRARLQDLAVRRKSAPVVSSGVPADTADKSAELTTGGAEDDTVNSVQEQVSVALSQSVVSETPSLPNSSEPP